MPDLNGNAPKGFYQRLLQLAGGIISSVLQYVQDGRGNNTPLQLSQSTVHSTGALTADGPISGAGGITITGLTPTTDETLSSVVIDGSGGFFTRLVGYDSGWKDVPTLSSGVGVYNYTGFTKPQVRVIGRIVFFQGYYPIGLSVGGSIQVDWEGVDDSNSTTVETTASGITITANELVLPKPLSATLTYEPMAFPMSERLIRKSFFADSGGTPNTDLSMLYRTKVQPVINANGTITIKSINTVFNTAAHGTASYTASFSDLVRSVSRVTAGQRAYDYSGYENSFDSTGATDQAVAAAHATDYHYLTFDGLNANTFGGGELLLDGLFGIIDKSVSTADIKTVFDAL